MKGKDFIITGLQSWDIPIGSNAIDIAREIAKENRVLYVNSPLDTMTLYRNKPTPETLRRLEVLKQDKDPLRKVTDNLWVLDFPFSVWSVNALPDGFIFDSFNKANNKKIFSYIKKTAGKLGFKNPIHFIDNDIYRSFYAKDLLNASLSVYYRRDNVQPYAYWKKHAMRLEPKLIQKSDLVVCNSPQLADYARTFNAKSYDVGQGVDLSAYNPDAPFEMPEALQKISQPRIGYIGDINSMRLDADLLYELAKSKPGYSFVMIGNEDDVFKNHALHQLQNVFFTGSIAKHLVPQYMQALDVCLNPQLINEITIGNYPRKVDEYLALGKPVIATATDTMQIFRDHVYLCNDADAYKAALEKALTENTAEKQSARIGFARSHSWQNNVQQIYKQMETLLN